MTKFRALTIGTKEWVKGYYCQIDSANTSSHIEGICYHYIIPKEASGRIDSYGRKAIIGFVEVDPSTIGQYACKDKKDKDAFAGDKVKIWYEFSFGRYETEEGILRWDEKEMMWMVNHHRVHNLHSDKKGNFTNIEVIGTADNPEEEKE